MSMVTDKLRRTLRQLGEFLDTVDLEVEQLREQKADAEHEMNAAVADAERLGRANSEMCDRISELERQLRGARGLGVDVDGAVEVEATDRPGRGGGTTSDGLPPVA